jgi:hypothetical protein
MVLRFALVAALAAALIPARAAAAQTPSIDPLAPCYSAAQVGETQPVQVNAHGFTPNAVVDVFVDDVFQTPPAGSAIPQADINGDLLNGSVPAPYIPLGVHHFTLRLAEHDHPDITVSRTSKVAALTVEQRPKRASTRRRVRFSGRGFTSPGMVYAHYVYAGHSHKTVQISNTRGSCGQFSRKLRQFPFKHSPKVGSWTIQFDQEHSYNPQAAVNVRLTIKVHRTIKPKKR